jgi:hypothetical protein
MMLFVYVLCACAYAFVRFLLVTFLKGPFSVCYRLPEICYREGVDSLPLVRLYKTTWSPNKDAFQRGVVTEWQNAPIAYDLFNWFKAAQTSGHITRKVIWPSNDEVGPTVGSPSALRLSALPSCDGCTSFYTSSCSCPRMSLYTSYACSSSLYLATMVPFFLRWLYEFVYELCMLVIPLPCDCGPFVHAMVV